MPEEEKTDDLIRLLEAWQGGNQASFSRLVDLVYDELVTIARSLLRRGPRTPTLGTGTVVHDAVLRLMNRRGLTFAHRSAFFALVARIMRNALTDRARRRKPEKDPARAPEDALPELADEIGIEQDQLLDIDAALKKLALESGHAVRIVEMRIFLGMTQEETAEALGVGRAKVTRDYTAARKWLARELTAYRNADLEDDEDE